MFYRALLLELGPLAAAVLAMLVPALEPLVGEEHQARAEHGEEEGDEADPSLRLDQALRYAVQIADGWSQGRLTGFSHACGIWQRSKRFRH